MLRPATTADTDAVVTLAHDEEIAWFGVAESSRAEIADYVRFQGGIESGVVFDDDGRIRGFALVASSGDGVVFLDPGDPVPPFAAIFGWVCEQGPAHLEVQPADTARIGWLEANGWSPTRSVLDLTREGTEPVEPPVWPGGVNVRPYRRGEDDVAVHRLVYVDAAYATVPGHPDRTLGGWLGMFDADNYRGWVAHRDAALVGWVMSRVLDDGQGWVHQLAVAVPEQRRGLGRALLLHACADLLAVGATGIGLTVQAANNRAIGLYRSVGLQVQKEWLVYALPAR